MFVGPTGRPQSPWQLVKAVSAPQSLVSASISCSKRINWTNLIIPGLFIWPYSPRSGNQQEPLLVYHLTDSWLIEFGYAASSRIAMDFGHGHLDFDQSRLEFISFRGESSRAMFWLDRESMVPLIRRPLVA